VLETELSRKTVQFEFKKKSQNNILAAMWRMDGYIVVTQEITDVV
jgi:hypothetical protein